MPRSAARTEECGPFTLFVGTGPWPYYARPRLGETHEFTADDVRAARARKRALGQPESFEWVHETTPSLLDAAQEAGLEVLQAPLMVLDRSAWRSPDPPRGLTLRILEADDATLATARAVQYVGFAATKRALAEELFAYVDRDSPVFSACANSIYGAGEDLLKRAQEAGAVRADVDISDVTKMVSGIAAIRTADAEQIDRILGLALDGLRVTPEA